MNCATCHGPLTKIHNQDYDLCPSCELYWFPKNMADSVEPIITAGRAVDGECPKCDRALQLGLLHDRWNVCFCENCRGFLIEMGAFQVAAHELRAAYQGQEDTPVAIDPRELDCRRDCPACLEPFETHAYCGAGNVVIDNCHACALTWLDHGELATIIRGAGKRPSPESSPVVPTYTHIPTDAVTESIVETTKFVIKTAFRISLFQ